MLLYINYNVSLGLSLISCFGTSSSINCGVITGKLKHDEVMDLLMIPLCEWWLPLRKNLVVHLIPVLLMVVNRRKPPPWKIRMPWFLQRNLPLSRAHLVRKWRGLTFQLKWLKNTPVQKLWRWKLGNVRHMKRFFIFRTSQWSEQRSTVLISFETLCRYLPSYSKYTVYRTIYIYIHDTWLCTIWNLGYTGTPTAFTQQGRHDGGSQRCHGSMSQSDQPIWKYKYIYIYNCIHKYVYISKIYIYKYI